MLQRFTKQSCYWHSAKKVSYHDCVYVSRCCNSVEASQCSWDLLSQEQQKQLSKQVFAFVDASQMSNTLIVVPVWQQRLICFWWMPCAMSGGGKHMGKQMVCTALLIFCAHLCSSHRWLIANCLVSFSVIKFSLSPMLTTLGSSSPVVQMGESSSGTWMLRGRR